MMRRHEAREGKVATHLDKATAAQFHRALLRLDGELRPNLRFAGGSVAAPRADHVIGTVALPDGSVVDVAPKTYPDEWIAATIALLEDDRIEAAGVRDVRPGRDRDLGSALARVYLRRVNEALSREGPLLTIHPRRIESSHLRGRLDVTQWLRYAALAPHRFPQTVNVMDAENEVTAAMAAVAMRLASISRSGHVASGLRQAAVALRPGLPAELRFDPSRSLPELPPQWRGYAPAWSITTSILRRTPLLGSSGGGSGVEVAVQTWPLLEHLLERSLDAVARLSTGTPRPLVHLPKLKRRLITPVGARPPDGPTSLYQAGGFTPDGALAMADDPDQIVATFEAKYARPRGVGSISSHVYQAITAAAATGAPIAVLAYPEAFPPVRWAVTGFSGRPGHVVAVGLGMYDYQPGRGDTERGQMLLDIITQRSTAAEAQKGPDPYDLEELDIESPPAP